MKSGFRHKRANRLSDFAGKIRTFRDVDDPVALQRRLRDSWKRGKKKMNAERLIFFFRVWRSSNENHYHRRAKWGR